jgi:hypothetical protein
MAERSKELVMVGYYLSKYGKSNPPNKLKTSKWRDAYNLFYDKLNEGRRSNGFEHSLKNSRDAFDGYFSETDREGWKGDDGNPAKLSGFFLDVYNEFEGLSENEVFSKIESLISPYIEKGNNQISRFNKLDLLNKVFNYSWIYDISPNEWDQLLNATGTILDNLVKNSDDERLVISLRNDNKKRLAVIFGQKYVGGFYLENNEPVIRFYVDSDFDNTEDPRFKVSDWQFADKEGKLIYCSPELWLGKEDIQYDRIRESVSELLSSCSKSGFKRTHLPFMYDVILTSEARQQFLEFITLDPEQRLLEAYRQYLEKTGNEEELYKWEIGKQFQENWDLEAEDFAAMLKSVKWANLISQQSGAFFREARKNPKDARVFFKYLFDESKSISERINWARDKGAELIKTWRPGWKTAGQDERTLSVIWSFNDLTKHAPYKSSFYTKYCELIDVKPEKAGGKYEDYLKLVDHFLNNYLNKDKSLVALHNSFLDPGKHISDPKNRLMAQNILFRILDDYWNPEDEEDEEEAIVNEVKHEKNIMSLNLNTIFYGPPGTGKTYNTINKALEIIGVDITNMERSEIGALFKSKVKEGQIVFTTFHQSFSYEDFIEGIKPVIYADESNIEGELKYTIEDGIFKELVERINGAQEFVESDQKSIEIHRSKFENNINKVSLGNSLDSKDDVIYDYCMNNDCVVIGFGEDIDFSGVKSRIEIRKRFQENGIDIKSSMDFNVSAIERLVLWMTPGQLVFVSDGNSKLKAIGEVSGDYFCDPGSPIRYAQFRKVKWLYKDLALPIEEIYGKKFSQQTIYQIDPKQINQSFFTGKRIKTDVSSNYVLVIDEINRGNVSSIFGELITLIEPDKRKGEAEELSAQLPYSKTQFTVPKNLYILGTMNTADRSVEALDTALRRRFAFEEMLPKSSLLRERGENKTGKIAGINLVNLLDSINDRIEILIDRDHTVGHAFFIHDVSLDDLRNTFSDKIIPLLQEYFYGDYSKMEMVIGSAFFEVKDTTKIMFAVKSEDFDPEGKVYHIVNVANKEAMSNETFKEALTKLIKGEA